MDIDFTKKLRYSRLVRELNPLDKPEKRRPIMRLAMYWKKEIDGKKPRPFSLLVDSDRERSHMCHKLPKRFHSRIVVYSDIGEDY